ncbi:MAG TPA: hypothetical protein VKE74_19345 [Gemmataceae bacterium]|nr:hypothetical protein [Gemmataceae bacterium]
MAVWWSLADRRPIGRSAVFPPACVADKRPRAFLEPVFIPPDLTRCAVHGFEYGGGSVVMDYVVLVAPGVSYEEGIMAEESQQEDRMLPSFLWLAGDYWEMGLEALAVSPDGRWLVAVGVSGFFSRWDLRKVKSGRKSARPIEAAPLVLGREDEDEDWEGGDVVALALSPDGKVLATGATDGEVQLFNLRSRKQVATLQPPAEEKRRKDAWVRGLAFSPDGKRLAARSVKWVTILDTAGKAAAARLGAGEVTDVAFHPDGTRLLTGGADERVCVWDTATLKEVGQYAWKIGPIHSVAVSPDGLTAAAGGDDSRVVVWDFGS